MKRLCIKCIHTVEFQRLNAINKIATIGAETTLFKRLEKVYSTKSTIESICTCAKKKKKSMIRYQAHFAIFYSHTTYCKTAGDLKSLPA